MNHKEAAAQLAADMETEFPDTAEHELGVLITELANERARMVARLAEAKEAFVESKKAELRAFISARKAAAEEALRQPVPKA